MYVSVVITFKCQTIPINTIAYHGNNTSTLEEKGNQIDQIELSDSFRQMLFTDYDIFYEYINDTVVVKAYDQVKATHDSNESIITIKEIHKNSVSVSNDSIVTANKQKAIKII